MFNELCILLSWILNGSVAGKKSTVPLSAFFVLFLHLRL